MRTTTRPVVCAEPGCPQIVTTGRCTAHTRVKPSGTPGYSDRTWQRISARYRRAHPVCEAPGCDRPSEVTDHIVSRAAGGTDADSNLQALCRPHHSVKTAARDGGYGNPRR